MERTREVSERQRRIAAVVLLAFAVATVLIVTLASDGDRAPAEPGRIDINLADARELELLPGIGPALADRIVAERERNGPFAGVDDLRRVGGVGERLVRRIGPHATVGE